MCELQDSKCLRVVVSGNMCSGCSMCERRQRTSVVISVMRRACEMMVWGVEKARVPVSCHSQRSRHAHVECVWNVVCERRGDWKRVVKGKEQEKEQKRRKSGKKDKHNSIF